MSFDDPRADWTELEVSSLAIDGREAGPGRVELGREWSFEKRRATTTVAAYDPIAVYLLAARRRAAVASRVLNDIKPEVHPNGATAHIAPRDVPVLYGALEERLIAVITATAAAEAWANRMLPHEWKDEGAPEADAKRRDELSYEPILKKLGHIIPETLGVPRPVDRGSLWGDFKTLVGLRNRWVHLDDRETSQPTRIDPIAMLLGRAGKAPGADAWHDLLTLGPAEDAPQVVTKLLAYFYEVGNLAAPRWLRDSGMDLPLKTHFRSRRQKGKKRRR